MDEQKRQVQESVSPSFGWLVLLVCFLLLTVVIGIRSSFGLFMKPWEQDFHWARSDISLASAISFIIYGMAQPICGRLVDRIGPKVVLLGGLALIGFSLFMLQGISSLWELYVWYGLLSFGVGAGSQVTITPLVSQWFEERKGLVIGIAQAGASAGHMVMIPLMMDLILSYGWSHTYLTFSLLVALVLLPGVLLLIREKKKRATELRGSKGDDLETRAEEFPFYAERNFWLLLGSFFVCGYTTTGLIDTHFVTFAHDHGIGEQTAANSFGILGLFNVVGTALSGYLCDRMNKRNLLAFIYFMRCLSLVLLMFVHDPVLLIAFAVMFGLFDFSTVPPTSSLANDLFGQRRFGTVLGWIFFSHQVGSALGAYLGGVLYDWLGSYQASIFGGVVLAFLAGAMVVAISARRSQASLRQTA